MAKPVGYTFAIATRNPVQTFVFCKWLEDKNEAVAYAMGELKDRSMYDVNYILIREGTNSPKDPVIWDSRIDVTSECVYCKTHAHTSEQCRSVIKVSTMCSLYGGGDKPSPTIRGRWRASMPNIQNLPNTIAASIEMMECRVNRDGQLADLLKFGHAITLDGKHVPYETVRKTEEDQ